MIGLPLCEVSDGGKVTLNQVHQKREPFAKHRSIDNAALPLIVSQLDAAETATEKFVPEDAVPGDQCRSDFDVHHARIGMACP